MATTRSPRRSTERRKFYKLDTMQWRRANGYTLLNGDRLSPGYASAFLPMCTSFQDFPEAPIFLSDAKLGPVDRDFDILAGYWFISDRMKSVFQAVDPEAFVFLQCDIRLSNGQEGPVRWLCDVVRVLDALDEEKSEATNKRRGWQLVKVNSEGGKYYDTLGPLFFKESVVGSCHIFKMKYTIVIAGVPGTGDVICDDEMRQACKSAQLKGISFSHSERWPW